MKKAITTIQVEPLFDCFQLQKLKLIERFNYLLSKDRIIWRHAQRTGTKSRKSCMLYVHFFFLYFIRETSQRIYHKLADIQWI